MFIQGTERSQDVEEGKGAGGPQRPWQVVGTWKTRGAYLVCSSWWVEKMGGGARWLPAGGSELDCGVGESH